MKAPEIDQLPIPEEEKENLRALFQLMNEAAKGVSAPVVLEVVGGAVSKPWPRKDIDVTVELDRQAGETDLERAQRELTNLRIWAEQAAKESQGRFSIGECTEPHLDNMFNNPNILAHSGSIQMKPVSGTPIELIPRRKE